jgi:hypothetical protein
VEALIAARIDAYAKVVLKDAKMRDELQWKVFDDKNEKQRALDDEVCCCCFIVVFEKDFFSANQRCFFF